MAAEDVRAPPRMPRALLRAGPVCPGGWSEHSAQLLVCGPPAVVFLMVQVCPGADCVPGSWKLSPEG